MKTALVLLMVCNLFTLRAQEKLGITMSNYSPVNSAFLNPSSTADSKTYMQLRLAGAHFFASNNFAYLPSFSLPGYLGSRVIPVPGFRPLERGTGFLSAAAEGPAFMISKNNFGAGIFIGARSILNVRRVPAHLADFLFTAADRQSDEFGAHLQNTGFSNMSWMQAGANFSYILLKRGTNMLQAGANISRVWGINVMHGNIGLLEGSYRDSVFTLGILRARFVQRRPEFFAGKGFAGDIGFTYKKMLRSVDVYLPHSQRSNCRNIPYKFKIAGSIRDIGRIRFNPVITTSLTGSGFADVHQQGGLPELPAIRVEQTRTISPAKAWLPVSASLQFDYNFENDFYLAAIIVKNMVPGQTLGVQSADMLGVAPRWETRHLEVSLPVILQRYTYPHVGFAIRLSSLVVGVDNLVPLLIPSNVNTIGVYANLSISLFRSRACNVSFRAVDECMPRSRKRMKKKSGFLNRVIGRNKTYSR